MRSSVSMRAFGTRENSDTTLMGELRLGVDATLPGLARLNIAPEGAGIAGYSANAPAMSDATRLAAWEGWRFVL